jgi:hypothetical protein
MQDVHVVSVSSSQAAAIAAPALAIALSPIPVVVALVLLVHNDRPRTASIAYLTGRAAALAALSTALLIAPGLSSYLHRARPAWIDWVVVAIGCGFIVLGLRMWLRRRSAGPRSASTLHTRVGGIPPSASAALGLFPPLVNPKVIAAGVAADTQIAGLSPISASVALVGYVLVAVSTVTAPIAVYVAFGSSIDHKLEHLRRRIQQHGNALAAATLVAVGGMILVYAFV